MRGLVIFLGSLAGVSAVAAAEYWLLSRIDRRIRQRVLERERASTQEMEAEL